MTPPPAQLTRPSSNIPPALVADLKQGVRAAVNAVARRVKEDANRNIYRVLGAGQRLSGGPSRPVRVVMKAARTDTEAAVVRATGPWPLIEKPRRGGYPIRPRRADALTVGGLLRAGVTGGAIVRPRAPITTVFKRAERQPRGLEGDARKGMALSVKGTYG